MEMHMHPELECHNILNKLSGMSQSLGDMIEEV